MVAVETLAAAATSSIVGFDGLFRSPLADMIETMRLFVGAIVKCALQHLGHAPSPNKLYQKSPWKGLYIPKCKRLHIQVAASKDDRKMFFVLAGLLFLAFVGNVISGSIDGTAILSNVQEMLLLFAAAISFSAAILIAEAKAKSKNEENE
ncbi:MAG: hypothetical protein AAGC83_00095 [Pseudomonadota bacterium]